MRYPAVAGMFYQANPESLAREVKWLLEVNKGQKIEKGNIVICPHAGYIYSGKTAALSFLAIEEVLKKDNSTAIIIGPNHTGLGEPIAVSLDEWKTPIGTSLTDINLALELIKNCHLMQKNELAHFHEHSIEVMLPFIQTINPKTKIVAICLGTQEKRIAKIVGQAIDETIKQKEFQKKPIAIIASSDFSHYLSGEEARKLDMIAIEKIEKLDVDGFEDLVYKKDLSICGYGPITAAMEIAKLEGKKMGKLLKYTNSGIETNSSEDRVVAYASIVFV
ncbi:MAG: AmmeMemoRadiSam system protein B [Candidatus Anstonellaceae archaeon]